MDIEREAKDFCEWWNVGGSNDVTTRKACREDAIRELTALCARVRDEAMEEAAKIADKEREDSVSITTDCYMTAMAVAEEIAKNIRALRSKGEKP